MLFIQTSSFRVFGQNFFLSNDSALSYPWILFCFFTLSLTASSQVSPDLLNSSVPLSINENQIDALNTQNLSKYWQNPPDLLNSSVPLSINENQIDALNTQNPVAHSQNPNTFSHLQNLVYKIYNPFAGGGTAFPIGPNLFVTNSHVVDNFINNVPEWVTLINKNGESLELDRWLKVDPALDLALFTTKQSLNSFFTLSDRESIEKDEKLFTIAYPSGKFAIMDLVFSTKSTIIDLILSQINWSYYEDYKYFENPFSIEIMTQKTQISSLKGASGSPILDQNERVVGVLSRGKKQGNRFYIMAQKSKHLKKMTQNLSSDCWNLRECFKIGYKNLAQHSIKSQDIFSILKLAEIYHYELRDYNTASELIETALNSIQTNQYRLYFENQNFLEVLQPFDLWQSDNWNLSHPFIMHRFQFNKNVSLFIGEIHLELIQVYIKAKNYEQAMKQIQTLISQNIGSGEAQDQAKVELGIMYREGLGVKQNYERALELFTEVIEESLGFGEAQSLAKVELGIMYREELGVTQNYERALELFTEVIEESLGFGEAQTHAKKELAMMYLKGLGVTQSDEKVEELMQEVVYEIQNPDPNPRSMFVLRAMERRRSAWRQAYINFGQDLKENSSLEFISMP